MDEQTCRDFLEKYFEGNFEFLSFMFFHVHVLGISILTVISNEEGVNRFVEFYMKETNEAFKLKYKKKDEQKEVYLM